MSPVIQQVSDESRNRIWLIPKPLSSYKTQNNGSSIARNVLVSIPLVHFTLCTSEDSWSLKGIQQIKYISVQYGKSDQELQRMSAHILIRATILSFASPSLLLNPRTISLIDQWKLHITLPSRKSIFLILIIQGKPSITVSCFQCKVL